MPSTFPLSEEDRDVALASMSFSDGEHASEWRWASGPTPVDEDGWTPWTGAEARARPCDSGCQRGARN